MGRRWKGAFVNRGAVDVREDAMCENSRTDSLWSERRRQCVSGHIIEVPLVKLWCRVPVC
jgi:hypothetical protein